MPEIPGHQRFHTRLAEFTSARAQARDLKRRFRRLPGRPAAARVASPPDDDATTTTSPSPERLFT